MRPFVLAALAAVSLLTAGCSGCSVLQTAADPHRGVLQDNKADELALGFALSAGTVLNNSYAAAAEAGLLSPELDARIYAGLHQYDALVVAARRLHAAGDARGYLEKISAAKALFDQLLELIPQPRKET